MEVKAHILKVLDQGVNKPSHSPYASPTGLANGSLTLCNAYRLLKTKNTQRFVFPSTHRRRTGIHGKVSNTSASTTSWSSARHLRNTNTCTTCLPPSRGTLVQRECAIPQPRHIDRSSDRSGKGPSCREMINKKSRSSSRQLVLATRGAILQAIRGY